MYQQILNIYTGEISDSIRRLADGASIPFAPDNTDYQEYLAWLAKGNTPLPADEL